jgi:hypothetical protein
MELRIYPITCDKFLPTRTKAILETWGSDLPKNVSLVFFGDEDVNTHSFVQINCMIPENVFPGRTSNPYEDGAHKFFNGMRHISAVGEDVDWVFICDDDTYVKTNELLEYCSTLDSGRRAVYANDRYQMYTNDSSLHYPSGGAGVLMSMSTLRYIVPHFHIGTRSTPDRWGDVMLGTVLREIDIPIIDHHVFFDLNSTREWMEWQWSSGLMPLKPSITYHEMTPELMRGFHTVHVTNRPPEFTKYVQS